MIGDGWTINFSMKCHNINLTMGEYVFNSPIISFPMGGVDVVFRVQWLQSLGTMDFDSQEIFMGSKRIGVKGYHRETKQCDKL